MPIEIRELVIRAAVEDRKEDSPRNSGTDKTSEYNRIKDQLRELKLLCDKRNER